MLNTVVAGQFVCNLQWNLFHHFFYLQHFIQNILAASGRCRNAICLLFIAHHLVFRVCTKRALNHWKHDCSFWQYEGCGGDVLTVLVLWFDLPYCIQVRTIVLMIDNKYYCTYLYAIRQIKPKTNTGKTSPSQPSYCQNK